MNEEEIKLLQQCASKSEAIYKSTNDSMVSYYNKPFNYINLIALMNSKFANILETEFIGKIFQAKRILHKLEKQYTTNQLELEIARSQFVITEHHLDKRFRQEAVRNGLETESSIQSHVDYRKTDFFILYEQFSTYVKGVEIIQEFFKKESRNVEGILSQGKALAYSGHKFSDDTALFGYGDDKDE